MIIGTQEPQPVPALVQPLRDGRSRAPAWTASQMAPLETSRHEQIVASAGSAPGPLTAGSSPEPGNSTCSAVPGSSAPEEASDFSSVYASASPTRTAPSTVDVPSATTSFL